MTEITDEFMKEMLAKRKNYCVVILKDGPNCNTPNASEIVWEHGRRNFALRRQGIMPIVCRVSGEGEVSGFCILTASVDGTRRIMDEDPGVKAGIFTYEVHPCRSFPGDCLP